MTSCLQNSPFINWRTKQEIFKMSKEVAQQALSDLITVATQLEELWYSHFTAAARAGYRNKYYIAKVFYLTPRVKYPALPFISYKEVEVTSQNEANRVSLENLREHISSHVELTNAHAVREFVRRVRAATKWTEREYKRLNTFIQQWNDRNRRTLLWLAKEYSMVQLKKSGEGGQ